MAEKTKSTKPKHSLPAKKEKPEQEIEYTAFGSDEKVKLTIRIIRDYIAVPTKAGHMPSLRDCLHFALMCRARALNPFEGDAYLVGYDGKDGPQFSLITAHQAFLKRAELNPDYDGMESGVIVMDNTGKLHEVPGDVVLKDCTLFGGWAKVYFKNKTHPVYKRLDINKYTTGRAMWSKNEALMIAKCARAAALREAFPTKLGGLYLREEMNMIDRGEPAGLPQPSAELPFELGAEPESETKEITETEKLVGKLKNDNKESEIAPESLSLELEAESQTEEK